MNTPMCMITADEYAFLLSVMHTAPDTRRKRLRKAELSSIEARVKATLCVKISAPKTESTPNESLSDKSE